MSQKYLNVSKSEKTRESLLTSFNLTNFWTKSWNLWYSNGRKSFFKTRIPETNDYHLLLATFWSKSFQGNGRFFSFEKSSSSSTAAQCSSFLFIPFSYADIHIANIRPKINFRKNATEGWKVDFFLQKTWFEKWAFWRENCYFSSSYILARKLSLFQATF